MNPVNLSIKGNARFRSDPLTGPMMIEISEENINQSCYRDIVEPNRTSNNGALL